MPIRPYLAGRTFAQETIAAMNAAFTEACKALDINAANASRALVAQTIISLVEHGTTDADQLAVDAVNEFRGSKRCLPACAHVGPRAFDYARVKDAPPFPEIGAVDDKEMWERFLYFARPVVAAKTMSPSVGAWAGRIASA